MDGFFHLWAQIQEVNVAPFKKYHIGVKGTNDLMTRNGEVRPLPIFNVLGSILGLDWSILKGWQILEALTKKYGISSTKMGKEKAWA